MEEERFAIEQIIQSSTPMEAFYNFNKNKLIIDGYKFIFPFGGDKNLPEGIRQRYFQNGAGVFNVFLSDAILVLDNDVVEQMIKYGKANYKIDYSLSLDTMIVSYLEPYLGGRQVPPDFHEIFEFLAQENIDINPMPYIYENIDNIKVPSNVDKIAKKIRAYEVLRTIDINKLRQDNSIVSVYSNQEINNNVTDYINYMVKISNDNAEKQYIDNHYKLRYCLLLKMVLIQLKYKGTKSEEKLIRFLDFCHNELNTMCIREIIIANEYFKNGSKLSFFGKIQKDRSDLLKIVRNMAWDLYHLGQIERDFTKVSWNNECDYYIPALLTYDKRLIEIIELYPLNAIAVSCDGRELFPSYNLTKFLSLNNISNEIDKYFSNEFKKYRDLKRCNCNIELIVNQLEEEVVAYVSK